MAVALTLPLLAYANTSTNATTNIKPIQQKTIKAVNTQHTEQAATAATQELTQEVKQAVDFCQFVARGTMQIAGAYQAEISKTDIISLHDESVKKLTKNLDAETVAALNQYWKDAIDAIYKQPIAKTDDEKLDFVTNTGETSFYSCLDQVLQESNANPVLQESIKK